MAKQKLNWKELNPAAFPVEVQKAVKAVHINTAAHYAAAKALPSYKAMDDATKAADKLLQSFADRIKVDGVILQLAGETLKFAYKYEKLVAASSPKAKASKADTELA